MSKLNLSVAIGNYDRWMREEFGQSHDHFHLLGEDNLRRYRPLREVRISVEPQFSALME